MKMDYSYLTKQVVDLQKMSFANWINAIGIVQDQTASAMDTIIDQNTWIPEQGRDAMQAWIKACRQEQTRFKSFIDQGFSTMEKFLAQDKKEDKKEAAAPKAKAVAPEKAKK
jgi:hypothetical protein